MKKVHPNDPRSGDTMTVKELREALSKYPDDMAVIAAWEGVGAGIRLENFSIWTTEGRGDLQIDVDNYG